LKLLQSLVPQAGAATPTLAVVDDDEDGAIGGFEHVADTTVHVDPLFDGDPFLVEDKANNTGENVRYMMDLLAREKGLENISSVLAIGQLHAARRFVMTLERHWPAVTKMFSAPNYYGVAKEDWYKDPVFREDVLREYRKIPDYKDKDFISEIDPAAMKQAIAVLPPPRGPLRKPPAGP